MNPNNHPEYVVPDFLDLSLGPPPSPPPPLPPQHILIPIISPHHQTEPQIPLFFPPQLPNPPIPLPSNHSQFFIPQQPEVIVPEPPINEPLSRQVRTRRNSSQNNGNGDNHTRTIPPPYPWATEHPAVVHNLTFLMNMQIEIITGTVQCSKCDRDYEVGFDLQEKVTEVWNFIRDNMSTMHDRAPAEWLSPRMLTCKYCSSDGVKPIISENKDNINWLFLFLGQLLGCCTLEQLKYFCACTHNHRTGAKDRVLYLTYFEILKQLLRL